MPGREDNEPAGIRILEERNTIPILYYLSEHGSCRKTDIYRDVTRNSRIPELLDMMEGCRIIHQERVGVRDTEVIISITDAGRAVVNNLDSIAHIITDNTVNRSG